ncbi:MAG: class D beta-lactamase [Bacteroidetes bacterium]|nr:class D beta-lactamase [Bacteroidota bacterium]
MFRSFIITACVLLAIPAAAQDAREDLFTKFGVAGCFMLCSPDTDSCAVVHPGRCDMPFLPASTFKILNSMIALEYRAVASIDDTIRWDGIERSFTSWNQDQRMREAFQRSCVWFYQELARRIGETRMGAAVEAAAYGNRDIGGGIDRFWLDGALRITPTQQADFLRRLWKEELPFSSDVQRTVKRLMVLERTDAYTLYGKTGTVMRKDGLLGWMVGFLQKGEDVYVYVLNVEAVDETDFQTFMKMRPELLKQLLQTWNLL